ncbi:MAG: 30S ribosomal protein S4 [Kiritimatiellae bacterium]|nr:30S ribosomal protein S4 [Kiritimatiellia bacterium]
MGRYTGPVCRQCRREGQKLFLKGARCYLAKCPIEQGTGIPGMHVARRARKMSEYGEQLRQKQSLRRQYGMGELQFHRFFQEALRKKGVTGEILLQQLELRLDNVVYRLGFAPSRRAARQYVLHGHVTVNGRKAAVPSMVLGVGDVVAVKDKAASKDFAQRALEAATQAQMPTWLNLDRAALKAEVVSIPTREQIAPIVDEQAIVELYSR